MFSMVFMMALSGSANMPAQQDVVSEGKEARYGNHLQVDHNRGWRGCNGCSGGGCWGGGCWGGGCWGGRRGGCHGGCWGGRWGGCHGGCYGGCSGSYSSCYGCGGGGYTSGYGGSYSSGYYSPGYSSGYYGNMNYNGSTFYGAAPETTAPRQTETPSRNQPEDRTPGREGNTPRGGTNPRQQSMAPGSATIVVQLPADASLTFDGDRTTSDSSIRTFQSPPLARGRNFSYTLKAQIVRDGQPVALSKQISVRAGETTDVTFDFSDVLLTSK